MISSKRCANSKALTQALAQVITTLNNAPKKTRLSLLAGIGIGALGVLHAQVGAQDNAQKQDNAQIASKATPELVGLLVNGAENPDVALTLIDAADTAAARVDFDEFLRGAGLTVDSTQAGVLRVVTPIGIAEFGTQELLSFEGRRYVTLAALQTRLAAKISFDRAELAVRAELPWRQGIVSRRSVGPALVPDVLAPSVALSRWRASLSGTHVGGTTSAVLDQQFAGILGPGIWNVQFSQNVLGGDLNTRAQAAWWQIDRGNHRALLGFDRVNLNQLLSGFQLTGVQYAYTNNAAQVFQSDGGVTGQIVPNSGQPGTVIQGEGPPGGLAELRVAGNVLDRQLITLDGRYEFLNVPAGSGRGLDIEVALYEFARPGVPLRVERFLSQAGRYQLSQGSYFHYFGVGALGDPFERSNFRPVNNQLDISRGQAAFYQTRYGLTERVTVEAAIQSFNGNSQKLVGTALNLGTFGSWAAYHAIGQNRATAQQLFGDGELGFFRWRADVIRRDGGFTDPDGLSAESHRAELTYEPSQALELSAVYGFLRNGDEPSKRFLKPGVRWMPTRDVTLRARPEFDGRYSYDASWDINQRTRLSAGKFGDSQQVDLQYSFSPNQRLRALSVKQFDDQREALILDSNWGGRGRTNTSLGVVNGPRTGFLAEISHQVFPGLDARLRAEQNSLFGASDELLVQFYLISDYSFSGGRPIANVSGSGVIDREGGIAGRLAATGLARDTLSGLPVLLNGQVRGYTQGGGGYQLSDLAPGVYRLSMDGEGLPIEYSIANPPRNVQVRSGAVTNANFDTALRLGFAGRVLNVPNNVSLSQYRVEIMDEKGVLVDRLGVNKLGFYRADSLPPGSYRAILRDQDGTQIAAIKAVALIDRFVFAQDFKLQ